MEKKNQREDSKKTNGSVRSVEKAFEILQLFHEAKPLWGISEIARATSFPKSTVHSLIKTIEACGILEKDNDTEKYRLGVEAFKLGYVARLSARLSPYVLPVLESLVAKTNEIVYLAVPYKGKVLYIEALYPPRRSVNYSAAGRVNPMHCTGLGKAMLAEMQFDEVTRIAHKHGLPKFTDNTITELDALWKELKAIKQRGYAVDYREHDAAVACVAVPVKTKEGQLAGAISISGAHITFSHERILELAEELTYTSSVLAQRLNHWPFQEYRFLE